MNKLRDNRGETLIESLVSVLIAVLAFAVLATSVVTAEKINAQTREERKEKGMFSYTNAAPLPPDKKVTLTGNGKTGTGTGRTVTGTVSLYESKGYYYYTYNNAGVGP